MLRRVAVPLVVLTALSTWPSITTAQASSQPQTRADLGRLTSRAMASMERAQWAVALAAWDSAFSIEANNYPLWFAAQAACQLSDTARAAGYFRRAEPSLRLNPENYPAFEADTLTRCLHPTKRWRAFVADMGRGYRTYTQRRVAWSRAITDSAQRLPLEPLPLDRAVGPWRPAPRRDHFALYAVRAAARSGDSLDVPFLTYIPNAYDPQRPAPLLVFLHGAVSGRSRFATDYEVARYEAAAQEARRRGWFFVWPYARRDFNWVDDVSALEAIATAIARVRATYHIDSARIVIGGHSDGGRGALWFALCHPGLATATVHFSTWPSVSGYGGCQASESALPRGLAPLFAYSGVDDGLYADSLTTPRWSAWQQRGAPLERVRLPGRGHDVGTNRDDLRLALDAVVRRWQGR